PAGPPPPSPLSSSPNPDLQSGWRWANRWSGHASHRIEIARCRSRSSCARRAHSLLDGVLTRDLHSQSQSAVPRAILRAGRPGPGHATPRRFGNGAYLSLGRQRQRTPEPLDFSEFRANGQKTAIFVFAELSRNRAASFPSLRILRHSFRLLVYNSASSESLCAISYSATSIRISKPSTLVLNSPPENMIWRPV